jgi:hypothetical protein
MPQPGERIKLPPKEGTFVQFLARPIGGSEFRVLVGLTGESVFSPVVPWFVDGGLKVENQGSGNGQNSGPAFLG